MAAKRKARNRGRRVIPRREHRINDEILAREVRLVGSEDPDRNGVFSVQAALRMAEEEGVDLVEIAKGNDMPVCRIIEYSKFKYQLKKRQKENKSKQAVVQMKEVRFGPNTDEHDFNFKLRHAQKFLEEGNKVKAFVQFRGRNIIYSDRGKKLLLEFAQALEDHGKVELLPKMEGRRMFLIMSPKKNS